MRTYLVELVAADGVPVEQGRYGFVRALVEVKRLRREWGNRRFIRVSCPFHADLDHDGLTERESEMVQEAEDGADAPLSAVEARAVIAHQLRGGSPLYVFPLAERRGWRRRAICVVGTRRYSSLRPRGGGRENVEGWGSTFEVALAHAEARRLNEQHNKEAKANG
jgi:hypothetical protein